MKRFISLFLVSILFLTACGQKNDLHSEQFYYESPKTPEGARSLEAIHQRIWNKDCVCGVAFLGSFQGGVQDLPAFFQENDYDLRWPFIMDIPEERCLLEYGEDLYLIVPGYPDVNIRVSCKDQHKVVYESEYGNSFLITVNKEGVEDDVDYESLNMEIAISRSDEFHMSFCPTTNEESEALNKFVSITNLNPLPIEVRKSTSADLVRGVWHGETNPECGSWELTLEFNGDGTFYYEYVPAISSNSAIGAYSGTWEEVSCTQTGFPTSYYALHLVKESGEGQETLEINLYITRADSIIAIRHLPGDHLVPGSTEEMIYLYAPVPEY